MSCVWAICFVTVGTLLNFAGLWCAGRALVHAWRAYGHGPLLPWLVSAVQQAVSLGRRLAPWVRRDAAVHSATATATAKPAVAVRPVARIGFPDELTDTERIGLLMRAVEGIYLALAEDRNMADKQHSAIHRRVDGLAAQLKDESTRLEKLSKEAVSQDVRLQLAGLVLIGLGTVLSMVPTIWELLTA
jgi:uncharacterized membrane protein YedE/YeeE